MFDEKSFKKIDKIIFSNNTVSRRIDEFSQYVENRLIEKVDLSE